MVNLELGTVDNGKSMSEILRDALEAKGYSQREFAKKMGWTPQNFSQRLKKNSFSAEEWRKMAYMLGYEVRLVELESGIEFESRRKGHGRRVRQVIKGVLYDTHKADMLCGNFYHDGEHEYTYDNRKRRCGEIISEVRRWSFEGQHLHLVLLLNYQMVTRIVFWVTS